MTDLNSDVIFGVLSVRCYFFRVHDAN